MGLVEREIVFGEQVCADEFEVAVGIFFLPGVEDLQLFIGIILGLQNAVVEIVLALVFALFSFLVFVAPNWREADEFERTLKKEQDEINRRSNNPLDAAPDGKGRQVPVK